MDILYVFIRKQFDRSLCALLLVLGMVVSLPVQALCSASLGKVVINEYNYISNYVELKVLDTALTAGGVNPFAGWKLALWKKQGQNMTKATEVDVSSNYTNTANNTCRAGATANYTYVRIPFAANAMTNDEVVVLWDSTGGKKIIDLFRLATTALAAYPASINANHVNYELCATIENALPSSAYDAPLVGTAGNKDIARLPDGTGPWTISPGTGAGSQQSLCGTNDALFNITKTPSSPAVGIGAANTFAWTINVGNGGTSGDLTNVIVSDTLPANMFLSVCPAGFTCAGAAGAYTSFSSTAGSTLVPGAQLAVTATAYVTAAGTYTNTVTATATELAPGFTQASGTVTASAIAGPEHVEFVHDGSALTCTPKAVTVLGCTTAASCNGVPANQYTAGSFSVTLGAITGATWCADSLCATTLANPATLSNGSVVYLKDANVRTDRMSGTVSSATNTAVQCVNTANGTFNATTACDVPFAASGFLVSLPNHVSCTNSVLTVQAVQSNNNATNCVPMFRNRTRDETISFAYSNPATGTLVPSVGGTALTGGSATVSLTFDNNGIATPAFVYQDAGQLSVTVTDPILPMTGSVQAVVAPASFVFSGIPAAPLVAGQAFNATVTAMNACATPATTPNFTGQTVTITSSNPQPGLGNATAINAPLTATSGTGSANLTWDEVGTIDLNANLPAYLGSALSISGSQVGVGRFHPAYFDTTVTPGCATFTYAGSTTPAKAGQPFTVTVKAKRFGGNAADATNTVNYAGAANAYITTLSNAGAVAGLANNTILAADFANGVGSASVTYAVSTPETAPLTLSMRATNADPTPVSSSGHTEGTADIRSGRARLGNAHGSELLSLPVPFRVQHWSGNGWVTNSADTCSGDVTLGAGNAVSVALSTPPPVTCVQDSASPGLSGAGCAVAGPVGQRFNEGATPGTGFSGDFNLWLKAPGAGNVGAVTVTGSVPTWLQFVWGGGVVSNPTARATFGVYKGNNEFIYLRENY